MASAAVGKVGFVGLGIMGKAMADNLIKAGYDLTVWNRTKAKCEEFVAKGAKVGETPAEVVASCDVTICMLADPAACEAVAFGEGGIVCDAVKGKGIIDMSTVDAQTSSKIGAAIAAKGGAFLEGPVSGSKKPAEDGTLIILAAGDEPLYTKALPLFEILGKKSLFLGDLGNGAKMKLVVNMVMGTMVSAFCEGMSLCKKAGLSQGELVDVLDAGAMSNPLFKMKAPAVFNAQFAPETVAFPLKHQQKDLRLALELAAEVGAGLPVAAASNGEFVRAVDAGDGDSDIIALYPTVDGGK